MKFFIVNAYGRSNRGDSVLLDECISEIFCAHPDANVSGALFEGVQNAEDVHPNVQWSERIGNVNGKSILSRIITISYLCISMISIFKFFRFFKVFLPKHQRITFERIVASDIIISAPGGYIHDTNFAYVVALFHIYIGVLLNKKVILAPQSIGPLKSKYSKILSRYILSRVTIICARESYTYEFLLNEILISKSLVMKCGDSAFWNFNEIVDQDETNKVLTDLKVPNGKPILGITFVGWSFPHSTSPGLQYDLYIKKMSQVIDYMVEKYNVVPVVFNQVDGDIPTAVACEKLSKYQYHIDMISREPEILRSLIRRSTIFLGTRFHSCIFAMMADRPTFAVSYLPKTEFIMNDLGLNNRYTQIDNFDVDYVIQQLSNDMDNNISSMNEIESAVQLYREKYPRLSDILLLEVSKS